MRILLADKGVPFDGFTPEERALGGAESAFIALAEAFAGLGHDVEARTSGARAVEKSGVRWRSLDAPWPVQADFYIANRTASLLSAPVKRTATAFWLHNPAQFLAKPRYALPLLLKRPKLVFLGPSHLATAPTWTIDGGRTIIPLGVEQVFCETPRRDAAPPPRAIFTSNPLRGLDRLISLWRTRIRPFASSAELHIYSGPQTYAGAKAAEMNTVLDQARTAADDGVVLRDPLPKVALARELAEARVLLYLGDPGETFCLAVAEAQAMGVPAVVKPVGAVGERVISGRTGFVEADEEQFARRAIELLSDDATWRRFSSASLAQRPDFAWTRSAQQFVDLANKR